MSLEDAIYRLAQATENNAAVREIMRQRDEAIQQRDSWKRKHEYIDSDRTRYQQRVLKGDRRIAALRGTITRMKRKAKEL
jgi:hypothetical protein